MKEIKYFLLAILVAFAVTGCGSETNSDSNTEQNGDYDYDPESDDDGSELGGNGSGKSLSTWAGHSVRTESGAGGKWVASIAFGEEVTLLGETETDEKSKREYTKLRLSDGKEGWARADFIAKDASLAAVSADAQIYKRPSISNITDEMVAAGTVVVLTGKKDEFSEFIAQNDAANKRKSGWLLGEKAITTEESDVAAALMLSKALAEKLPSKRKEKLQQVVDMYSSSIFAKTAENALDAADASTKLAEDELMVVGENVNVRSEPDVKQENKIFQLNTGDVCKILKRGDMDEIGGKLDYWYNISNNGKSGWIFGTFTSKAL